MNKTSAWEMAAWTSPEVTLDEWLLKPQAPSPTSSTVIAAKATISRRRTASHCEGVCAGHDGKVGEPSALAGAAILGPSPEAAEQPPGALRLGLALAALGARDPGEHLFNVGAAARPRLLTTPTTRHRSTHTVEGIMVSAGNARRRDRATCWG